MTLAAGTRLGRYELRLKIGEGGMGEVYRARDEKLNREVAVKVCRHFDPATPLIIRYPYFCRQIRMMNLVAGTKLGRYEIRSKLGEGGMGEVYLAEDEQLHRKIALKILPADVASNQDRMRRFEQE